VIPPDAMGNRSPVALAAIQSLNNGLGQDHGRNHSDNANQRCRIWGSFSFNCANDSLVAIPAGEASTISNPVDINVPDFEKPMGRKTIARYGRIPGSTIR